MVSRLFISYRRDDSAGYAGRLYDRLEREFGRDHLVMDVDAIPLGANFVKVLGDEVAKCDLLLAIIGPGWLEARDEEGKRRLENPQDFVRIEIGTALKRGIPVIPIVLEGTRIPKVDQLPDDLKELTLRNGLNVRHVSFLDDLERLIRGLKRAQSLQRLEPTASSLIDKSPQQSAEEEAQRKATEEAEARRQAEEESRRRVEEDAQRKAAEEAEVRRQAEEESRRRVEEDAQRKAAEEADARCKQETAEWGAVVGSNDKLAIEAFLERWPNGQHAKEAQVRIAALEREAAEARAAEQRAQEMSEWREIAKSTDAEVITAFLKRWPNGRHAEEAQARIAGLRRGILRRGILLGAGAIGVVVLAWVAIYQGEDTSRRSSNNVPAAEEKAAAEKATAEKAAAKAAAEAEARARAEQVEKERLAAIKAEEERKAKADAETEARRKAEGTSIIEGAAVDGATFRIIREVTAIEDCSDQCIREPRCEMFAYWNNKICYLFDEYFSTYPTTAAKVGYLRGSKAEQQRLAALKAEEALSVQPGSGQSFRDRLVNGQPCPMCPEMVVVPKGKFTMGSPASEPGRGSDEVQVSVSIAGPFAAGKYAVTRGEFAAFVEETGYRTKGGCFTWSGTEWKWKMQADKSWRAPGFTQVDRHPVVCVTWTDAKTYAEWLSRKTGKAYRLLSESEREYVTRAGTTTPFWWGNSITPSQANYNGNYLYAGGGSKGEFRMGTVTVDSFKANPWGLYNVHGNVWEWTEDCWNESNSGNPGNGSARNTGDCDIHVGRGGTWVDGPGGVRSADRLGNSSDERNSYLGFRVGRTLTP